MTDLVVLAGAACSGKGDLSKALEGMGFVVVSSSGLIAADKANMSEDEKKRVAKMMGNGDLYDDTKMIALVDARLKQISRSVGVILDGFPRTVPQARYIHTVLGRSGYRIIVMSLEASHRVLVNRLYDRINRAKRGEIPPRAEDNINTFEKRYKQHMENWPPLMNYFVNDARMTVNIIDAEKDRPGVFLQAERVLRPRTVNA